MLRPLLLLQSVDRAVDSLQELWEPWLGTLKLWFRKTGQQESFLSSAVCFYFVFFPSLSFFLNLSLSLLLPHSIKLWSGKACLPTFDLVFFLFPPVFVGGLWCWSQQKLQESTMSGCLLCCSLACCRGRALLSDLNRKAFISSTCHDFGNSLLKTLRTQPVESLIH